MTITTSPVHETAVALAEKLRPLFNDDGVKQLLAARPNIWSIIEYRDRSYETRYSRMLRWLLDPAENHGLGGRFAKLLLEVAGAPFNAEPTAAHTRTSADSGSVHKSLSHVDVFVACTDPAQPFTLTIENKVFSQEHSDQLAKYATAVEAVFAEITNKAFIFLTPDGRKPADEANHALWLPLSYDALHDVLEQLLEGLPTHARTRYLIEDFRDDIQQKFDTDFNARVVHPLALPQAEGGFGEDLADLAAHTRGKVEDTDEPIEDQGFSGDASRGSALYEELRNLLVAPAESAAGVSEHAFEGLLGIVTDESRMRQVGSQDHSPNPVSQAVIAEVFSLVADLERPHNESVTPGAPGSVCAVRDERFLTLGIQTIRRTGGKGQGLYFYFAPKRMNAPAVYISGDSSSTMPNDPVYFRLFTGARNDEKIIPYHLGSSDAEESLKEQRLERAKDAWWVNQFPDEDRHDERVKWLIDWTLEFTRLARAHTAATATEPSSVSPSE